MKMANADTTKMEAIGKVLNDDKRPLKERFRALFTLKNIGGEEAIDWIKKSFEDPSALLKHELAYCLGQMQDSRAIPVLIDVLKDINQEPMVRHEAGEALGAIGDDEVIPILEEYSKDPVIEVAETCQLALKRINWLKESKNHPENLSENPYSSVDPAPPCKIRDVEKLKEILLNENASLFERYRAMFSLRNLRTAESVLALGEGLRAGSALFRHEVAFVLGQLQEEISVPFLQASLEDPEENEMVRHECAEALGAIAHPTCEKILNKYVEDSKRVVRESCIIALDMCEYENSPEFQYADTLTKVSTH
ncbi:deoxyhypusine hydroxylase [Fopius arisanus]|uniref:Deoxyhypusine hydroxylase n=1 Tax=Fopius arisanus TaxID=64838 RepID=A0A0C9RWZ7_9HYME|nr:PREDICTED: deoxyhypusine hydroxylase [Fopius arisanus]XP_011313365.1 PREDICTED: deoxyhypusine hydroxylase [Fopius arisanus]